MPRSYRARFSTVHIGRRLLLTAAATRESQLTLRIQHDLGRTLSFATAGNVKAKPQGGDTRSRPIKAFRSVILAAVATLKDISLVALADLLRTKHGASLGASTVW